MIRRGTKTTELLVTLATGVAVLAGALQGSLPPKWAAIAGSIAAAGYAVSRGLTKMGGAEAFPSVAEPPAPIAEAAKPRAPRAAK